MNETEQEKKQRHAKISEAVSQIGRLIEVCAKNGLDKDDILIMLQTSTSLFCEMNEVPIGWYMQFLYVVHQKRLNQDYLGSDESTVHKELRDLFSAGPISTESVSSSQVVVKENEESKKAP